MARNKRSRQPETAKEELIVPAPPAAASEISSIGADHRDPHGPDAVRQGLWSQTLVQAWLSIAVWMTFGVLLEGLLGFKTPSYLQDEQRRELFRLAHTHGTFLGLLLIAAALCGQHFKLSPPRIAVIAFRLGATIMPIGFLLAGIWHYESDPGLAIWLVPPAALLLVFASVAFALASRANLSKD